LEALEKIDTLIVDKTGTLTQGKPVLSEVAVLDGFREEDVLSWTASLERASEHSLAEAIVQGAHQRNYSLPPSEDFEVLPGRGIQGKVSGRELLIGNRRLLADAQIPTDELEARAAPLQKKGHGVILVAIDQKPAG